MEPRDSLLENVLDKYKQKDLIEILQVPDLQGLVNLGFLILVFRHPISSNSLGFRLCAADFA
jgi:hypothetical protein